MNITITRKIKLPEINPFEVVERKGIGHPDTVADALAEKLSIEYSKYCLGSFGAVLHHNFDKLSVLGGLVDIDWGKGVLTKPIRVIVNGRFSASFNRERIPIKDIYAKVAKEMLNKCLPSLAYSDVKIIDQSTSSSKNHRWFHPLSIEDIPDHFQAFANDTSAIVSYWPLTPAEQVTLDLEGYFYDTAGKPKHTEFGQDIKVMTVRKEKKFDITLCVPFFAKYVPTYDSYWRQLALLEEKLHDYAQRKLGSGAEIDLKVNAHDQRRKNQRNAKSFYFVAAGGALDFGEEGVVGRGNNRLGIIPSFRPYTMEAAPGKNPVYHVGKVLGLVADTLAKEIATKFSTQSEVWIITRNADPLFQPHNIIVNLSSKVKKEQIKETVNKLLESRDWTNSLLYKEAIIARPGNKY